MPRHHPETNCHLAGCTVLRSFGRSAVDSLCLKSTIFPGGSESQNRLLPDDGLTHDRVKYLDATLHHPLICLDTTTMPGRLVEPS
jgi:hypothetical protein